MLKRGFGNGLAAAALLALAVGCSRSPDSSAPPSKANQNSTGGQSTPPNAPGVGSATTKSTGTEKADANQSNAAHMQKSAADAGAAGTRPIPPKKLKPLFDGWPKPKLAIVLTGEQHGSLEPCGCAEMQSGGISRRADLLRVMRDKKWEFTAFDLGGTIKRNRTQSQIKFQTTLAAFQDMHYTALALGPEELRLDPFFLLSQHVADPEKPNSTLTFLGANVVLLGDPNLGTPQHFKVVTVNGVKIGVTAILGPSLKSKVVSKEQADQIAIEDPAKVLPDVIKQLKEQQCELLVLLAHGSSNESTSLAKDYPAFNLILTAGGAEDPLHDNPKSVGDTMIVSVGHKGKYVGVVGFFSDDAKQRLRFELVNIAKDRFQDTKTMRDHMRLYQEQLRDLGIAVNEATKLSVPHSSGANFVGAEKCGECHTKAYAKWKTTPHAHAYQSLITGRKGEEKSWISRIYDPECLACHVVGWHPQDVVPFTSGFVEKKTTPNLLGVQCENCHGPGSEHIELVELDDLVGARKTARVTLPQAKDKLCYSCHDLDNSPHFDFDKYWKKIIHPGLD